MAKKKPDKPDPKAFFIDLATRLFDQAAETLGEGEYRDVLRTAETTARVRRAELEEDED